MAEIDFLCLANSRMKNGRCIAGINLDTGVWIRLTSNLPTHAYTLEETKLDTGSPIRPLDIAKLKLGPPNPSFSQAENVLADGGSWRFVRRIDIEQGPDRKILRQAMRSSGELLNTPEAGAISNAPDANRIPSTLALIQVKAPAFRKPPNISKRCRFNYKGSHFDLPYTDDLAKYPLLTSKWQVTNSHDWLLTVSLGQLHKGAYWKLVAGAIPLIPLDLG